jgi:hypothetical protein
LLRCRSPRQPKPFAFPESTPAKLLRRAIVGCNADGACTLTLLLQRDAKPAAK